MTWVPNVTSSGGLSNGRPLISSEFVRLFRICFVPLTLSLNLVGCFTNSVNIRTFTRMKLEDSITLCFFFLSLSDLFLCTITVCEAIAETTRAIVDDNNIYLALPPNIIIFTASAFKRTFNIFSMMKTTYLAIQGCLCVIRPIQFRDMFTRLHTSIYCCVCFLFGLVSMLVVIAKTPVVKTVDPVTNRTRYVNEMRPGFREAVTFVQVGTGLVLNPICQIVILICLGFMFYGLQQSAKFRKEAMQQSTGGVDVQKKAAGTNQEFSSSANKERQNSKESQALIQVTLVSVIFVVCNIPFLANSLAAQFIPELNIYRRYHNLANLCLLVIFFVESINCTINILVYYNFNSKFRKLCFLSKGTKGQKI